MKSISAIFFILFCAGASASLVKWLDLGDDFVTYPATAEETGIFSVTFSSKPDNVTAICFVPYSQLIPDLVSTSPSYVWKCRPGASIGFFVITSVVTSINITQLPIKKASVGIITTSPDEWEFYKYTPEKFIYFSFDAEVQRVLSASPKPAFTSYNSVNGTPNYFLLLAPNSTLNITNKYTTMIFDGDSIWFDKFNGVVQCVCAPLYPPGAFSQSSGSGWQGIGSDRDTQVYCVLVNMYFVDEKLVSYKADPTASDPPLISTEVTTIKCKNSTEGYVVFQAPPTPPGGPYLYNPILLKNVKTNGDVENIMGAPPAGLISQSCVGTDYMNISVISWAQSTINYNADNVTVPVPFGAYFFTVTSSTKQQGAIAIEKPYTYLNLTLQSWDSMNTVFGQIYTPSANARVLLLNFGVDNNMTIYKKNSPLLSPGNSVNPDPKFPAGPLIEIPSGSNDCVEISRSDGAFTNELLDQNVGDLYYTTSSFSAPVLTTIMDGNLWICRNFLNSSFVALEKVNATSNVTFTSVSRSGTKSGTYGNTYYVAPGVTEIYSFPTVSGDGTFAVNVEASGKNLSLVSSLFADLSGSPRYITTNGSKIFSYAYGAKWFYGSFGATPSGIVFVVNKGNETASFSLHHFVPKANCDANTPCYQSTCVNGYCSTDCDNGYSGFNCQIFPFPSAQVAPSTTNRWTRETSSTSTRSSYTSTSTSSTTRTSSSTSTSSSSTSSTATSAPSSTATTAPLTSTSSTTPPTSTSSTTPPTSTSSTAPLTSTSSTTPPTSTSTTLTTAASTTTAASSLTTAPTTTSSVPLPSLITSSLVQTTSFQSLESTSTQFTSVQVSSTTVLSPSSSSQPADTFTSATTAEESRANVTILEDVQNKTQARTLVSKALETEEERVVVNDIYKSTLKRQTVTTIDFTILDREGDNSTSVDLLEKLADKINNNPEALPFKATELQVLTLNRAAENTVTASPSSKNPVMSGSERIFKMTSFLVVIFALVLC